MRMQIFANCRIPGNTRIIESERALNNELAFCTLFERNRSQCHMSNHVKQLKTIRAVGGSRRSVKGPSVVLYIDGYCTCSLCVELYRVAIIKHIILLNYA